MKDIIFKGCGTALITPFSENGVDFDELGRLIEYQILEGADALIVCGTTGESATMTLEEKKQVIAFSVKTAKNRIPIIAGTGGNDTKSVIALSQYAQQVKADGSLIVTPYYNKTTQAGLIAHYKKIAQSTNLPIILYNVPSRTGVNIEPITCLELSKIDNIVAIKEASGNISQIAEIASLCRGNLTIYSGNDDQTIPILSLGGLGVISVLSNLYPAYVHHMVYDYFSGNLKKALCSQLNAVELTKALFCEVNPIPIKYAMERKGFHPGKLRLPLIELSEKGKEKIDLALQRFSC